MAGMLAGKTILITGAASGIGRATSLICAREGAAVIVVDLNRGGGEETVAQIVREAGKAAFVRADMASGADIDAAVAFAVERHGRLDGAFNNAALPEPFTPMLDADDDMFDRIMTVNVKGVWHCMRAEIRQMKAQGSGAIVNTASVAGLRGANRMPIYSASKHAVVGLTKSAALEFARAGLRINAVCPGVIDTPMLQGVVAGNERAEANYRAQQPIRRFGQPQEIGEAVAWLLSDAASRVTGIAMPVDGGMMS